MKKGPFFKNPFPKVKALFVFTLIISISCKDEEILAPISAFTFYANAKGEITGAIASFSNISQHANSFEWNFGDGGSSTERSPNHSYNANGPYVVKLKAIGNDGTIATSEQIVTVTNALYETGWMQAVVAGCYSEFENHPFQRVVFSSNRISSRVPMGGGFGIPSTVDYTVSMDTLVVGVIWDGNGEREVFLPGEKYVFKIADQTLKATSCTDKDCVVQLTRLW